MTKRARIGMKSRHAESEDLAPHETAPGLRVLKELWDIESSGKPREKAPANVGHDIYNVPARGGDIPRRVLGRARPK